MSTASTDAEPGTIVIRFENQRGALVTVTKRAPQPSHDPHVTSRHTAECAGCLDGTDPTYTGRNSLGEARTWANTHAAECRALPQPDEQV